jgi:hypothetical protein
MNALKILSEMDYNYKRDLYKSVPAHAMPKARFSDKDTNSLTKAVLRWLELNGHYCSRIQSQGQYNPTLKLWTKSTVKRGIADILTIIAGQTVMIEIKCGRDKQSPYQKETQIEVEQSGGTYLIVKSFDEFMTWYKNFKQNEYDRK